MKNPNIDMIKELESLQDSTRVQKTSQYMQAEASQNSYALGDIFVGIRVPFQKQFVKKWKDQLSQEDLVWFLSSPIHEYRSIGLTMLVEWAKKSKTQVDKDEILAFYRTHLKCVNHWDLVDLSSPTIVGGALFSGLPDISLLEQLSLSKSFWEARIALVSTLFFIQRGVFEPTFQISKRLFGASHPMVQKALGWMIKEVGDRNQGVAVEFLRQYGKEMSSLALSRAKEKYSAELKSTLKF